MPNAPEPDRPESTDLPSTGTSSLPTSTGAGGGFSSDTSGNVTGTADGAASANADDEFLDYEPLTPELLEEEAIRGDFVLRWAVVLMALLLASTRIAEPRTLLHMKSGEYMVQNSTVPRVDVFSASIEGRPWTNLAWGFDLLTHVIGDATWLTLIKALLMALTFGILVHISRPGVSSWWGSICAATAVITCMPHFTVEPHIFTLLGTAILLWFLHSSSFLASSSRRMWMLVPMFLVWANLDSRVFIGLFFLLLYVLGTQIEAWIRSDKSVAGQGSPLRTLWLVTAACLLVVNVHPFLYRVLAYPLALYGQEYPAYRAYQSQQPIITFYGIQFFSLIKAEFWNAPYVGGVLGIVLMAASGAALILNWTQVQVRWLLVYLGAVLLAFATVRELPVCSLVFCVVTVLNSQEWFQSEFRQTYIVSTPEILFSRGGRAATVLLLALVAFLGGTGKLSRSETVRIGYGFDPQLLAVKQSLSDQLENSYDNSVFNSAPAYGDILIYLGYKPYFDNRTPLYTGTGSQENIADRFLKIRKEIQTGEGRSWREEWNRLKLTHGLFSFDFDVLFRLMRNEQRTWVQTRLGARGSVFYLIDSSNAPLMDYLRKNHLDFIDAAIAKAEPVSMKHDPISPKSVYEKYLWSRKRDIPNKITEALLLVRLAQATAYFPRQYSADLYTLAPSLAILSIRRAHEGLAINPDCPQGYLAMGLAYSFLAKFETEKIMLKRQPLTQNVRYVQAVTALNQVLIADPDNIEALKELHELYLSSDRADLLLRTATSLTRAYRENKITVMSKQHEDSLLTEQTKFETLKHDLEPIVEQMDAAIRDRTSEGQSIPQIVSFCMQNGYSIRALEQLDKAAEILTTNPQLQQLRIELLLETGEVAKADEDARRFQQSAPQRQIPGWEFTVANALLPAGDHSESVRLLTDVVNERQFAGMKQLLQSYYPRVSINPLEPWPLNAASASSQAVNDHAGTAAEARLRSAQMLIEMGEIKKASQQLAAILEENPEYANRILVRYYYLLLTGNEVEFDPPSKIIPVLFEKGEESGSDKQANGGVKLPDSKSSAKR